MQMWTNVEFKFLIDQYCWNGKSQKKNLLMHRGGGWGGLVRLKSLLKNRDFIFEVPWHCPAFDSCQNSNADLLMSHVARQPISGFPTRSDTKHCTAEGNG